MKKSCLECGEKVIGRSDKKFCSDDCRSSYYNKRHKDATNYMRNVNNTLRKNRQILRELNPEGKTKIHRDKLVARGFDFTFFTNVYKTKKGAIYYFCYEQGYLPLEDNYFALVTRMESRWN